ERFGNPLDLLSRFTIDCAALPPARSSRSRLIRRGPAHGNPAVLEARPKNERYYLAVTPDPFFNAVGTQVSVVDAPARLPKKRQLATLQAIVDRLNVAPRPLRYGLPEPTAIVGTDFASDLPIQAEPAAVLRSGTGANACQPGDEVCLSLVGEP